MKKAPNLYTLEDLKNGLAGCSTMAEINGKWVPVRPLGLYSFKNRIRLALMVFKGTADALLWSEGQ